MAVEIKSSNPEFDTAPICSVRAEVTQSRTRSAPSLEELLGQKRVPASICEITVLVITFIR